MKFLAVAAVALLVPLAGCMGGDSTSGGNGEATPIDPASLSAKTYKLQAPQELWTPSSVDGKRLNSVVYLPETTEKVPVFINFSPYWGDSATREGDHFSQYMIHEYVERGYAVVLSAVRGTGHSEGCFEVGGDLELQDTRDVIDDMAKQSWSTGMVAAGGKSYDSTSQNGVIAKFPTPNLKGLFHVSGITDMYRYNAKDGVVYNNGLTFTPRYAVGQGLDEYGLGVVDPIGITGSGDSSPMDESPESLARLIDDVACPEILEHVRSGEGTAVTGQRDDYWQERDWVSALPGSSWDGSVFFVHGLQDWNVKPDDIDPWVDILQAKGNPVLGWLHQQTENGGHLYPMRADWNQTMLRWLDATLKGNDAAMQGLWGFEVEGSDGLWRRSDAWPPAAATPVGIGATAGGASILQGAEGTAGLPGGPSGTRIVGVPYATVMFSSNSPDPIARAQLFVRHQDGSTTWVNEAVARPILSRDLTEVQGYTFDTVALNFTFYPMDLELEPSDTLTFTFGVGADEQSGGSTTPAFVWTPLQVAVGTYGGESVLTVHTMDVDAGLLDVQPEPTPCFAC